MILRAVAVLLLCACYGAAVNVRFAPRNPQAGPYPSDALTVPDPAQKTGLRVDLPLPDCAAQPSLCAEIAAVNRLDGFSRQPRIRVSFSGPVDIHSLRQGVWIVALEPIVRQPWMLHENGQFIPINEVLWDPASHTAFAKPDNILDQDRPYAIVVTDAVRAAAGDPVLPDPAFDACASPRPPDEYCAAVSRAVALAAPLTGLRRIVAVSVFTTLSATDWMEKAHARLPESRAEAVMREPRGGYRLSALAAMVWRRQTAPARFEEFAFPLDNPLLAGISRIAFGTFRSPDYLNASQAIDTVPTNLDVPLPAASNEIGFTVYVPEGAEPPGGWPVVIFGHGLGDSRFGGATAVAPVLAQAGFATVAINAVGHGFGPESAIVLADRAGNRVTIPAPGRGVDLDRNGAIDAAEGCILPAAGSVLRDCLRQTALDLSQLVRVIRGGIQLDDDPQPDLDGYRIYYAGQSLGALYGTLFNAIEPEVRAAVLNAGGGSVVDIARWSPGYRDIASRILGQRQPPLILNPDTWDENYVLRYRHARVVENPAAVAAQELLELYDWLGMPGDPVAFAPHLRSATLAGRYIKPVLFQVAWGDRSVPNPASTRLVRAANMREYTWIYRHDRARAAAPDLPANPHPYLVLFLAAEGNFRPPDLRASAIALSTQQQIANFFRADGAVVPDPNNFVLRALFGRDLFEAPDFLPEDLNF